MASGGVAFEYGALREAIVGRADGFRIPQMGPELLRRYAQFLPEGEVDFIARGQGQALIDYAPEFAAKIAEQIEQVVRLLKQHGVVVHRPRPLTAAEEKFPGVDGRGGSLFYVRDPILVVGRCVIDLALRMPFRRRQRFALREIIETKVDAGDLHLISMPEPLLKPPEGDAGAGAFLEGGDVLLNGSEVYVGISGQASSISGAQWLQRTLGEGVSVHVVKLAESVLHLDCALSLPRPGLAIACLEALPHGLPGTLRSWDVIEVSLSQAQHLACNGLILDSNSYVIDRRHGSVGEQLARHGINVIDVEFDLPARFGGSLRCAHHPLLRN